jgi:hypothetical protein
MRILKARVVTFTINIVTGNASNFDLQVLLRVAELPACAVQHCLKFTAESAAVERDPCWHVEIAAFGTVDPVRYAHGRVHLVAVPAPELLELLLIRARV